MADNTEDLKDYIPSDSEEFMNEKMLKYFESKLLQWKTQLLKETEDTVTSLQQINETKIVDELDAVSNELNIAFDLRTKDRARKLINKIDQALGRINDGSYGYCQDTGEPISVKRLDARPITVYSIKAQERHEALEKANKLFKNM